MTDGSMLVLTGGKWSWSKTTTPPSGMNERTDQKAIYLADEPRTTAGATGDRVGTISGTDDWSTVMLAIAPAIPTTTPGYTYDANGNMTSDGVKCYHFNEANQMDKVTNCSGQTIAEYVYDYNGNRMVKRNFTSGTLANTVTSWSDSFETKAIVGGATESTSYYFANGQLIAKKDNAGNRTYFHNDHLGSTSVVSSQSGALVESTTYDPWGEIKTGGTKSKFLYTGQEKDGETGLNYYNARYYDSHIRRFTQPDDIIQDVYSPQTLNRYSYVMNNPLKYTDPTGHISILDYNKMLSNPTAKNYNDVMRQFGNTKGNTAAQGFKTSGGGNYSPEKDKGGAKDIAKPVYNSLLGNDIKTIKNPNSNLAQKGLAGISILGNVYLPAKSAKFVSEAKSVGHFMKHGVRMGYKTEEEYLEGARKLFQGGDGVDAALRSNGDALFYREATKEFGIITSDNIIRTYFPPSGGVNYFLREISK